MARPHPRTTPLRKTVLRLNVRMDPLMDDRFSREPDIDLVNIDPRKNVAADDILRNVHVYQILSTKDELDRAWLAGPAFLTKCPDLLCVSTTGAGYDTVDVHACTARGVLVVNQAGANAATVAEHTFGLMIGLSKRIAETDRLLRHKRGFARQDIIGHDIGGKCLGLIGIGHVGTHVAALGRAFGMSVIAYDPYVDDNRVRHRGAEPRDLANLLREADFVSLHCPRNNDTIGMFNAASFSQMKPSAFFITTARGGIHDEQALVEALSSGRLGGAGLDVWDREPPPLDNPLLALENVIATYHSAGLTHEARHRMAIFAADQIISVLRGRRPPRLVNPEVWPAYRDRFREIMGKPVTRA